MAGKGKPGPPRQPHNKPRGTHGKSGPQFTAKSLARIMRNVDRDVLREAVALANIQDMFTPAFETEMYARLDKVTERQAFLETIAFGTILLKIVRTIMLFLRFLPQARLIIIMLAIFTVVDRAASSKALPSKEEIAGLAESTGLSSVLKDLKQEIAEALNPYVESLEFVQETTQGFIRDAQFALQTQVEVLQRSYEALLGAREQGRLPSVSTVESINFAGQDLNETLNAVTNMQTLILPTLNQVVGNIKEFTGQQEAEAEAIQERASATAESVDPIRDRLGRGDESPDQAVAERTTTI